MGIGAWSQQGRQVPGVLVASDGVQANVDNIKASVKFQLKSKKTTCMGVPIGNVQLSVEDNVMNIMVAVNFLVSLLPKNWMQVKRLYVKSTMGPSHRIFGF